MGMTLIQYQVIDQPWGGGRGAVAVGRWIVGQGSAVGRWIVGQGQVGGWMWRLGVSRRSKSAGW